MYKRQEKLIRIVDDAFVHGYSYFTRDLMATNTDSLNIQAYEYTGEDTLSLHDALPISFEAYISKEHDGKLCNQDAEDYAEGKLLYYEYGNISRDRKSTRLNSSHIQKSRMPSSA